MTVLERGCATEIGSAYRRRPFAEKFHQPADTARGPQAHPQRAVSGSFSSNSHAHLEEAAGALLRYVTPVSYFSRLASTSSMCASAHTLMPHMTW